MPKQKKKRSSKDHLPADHYPAFIKLKGKKVVVIGGGSVAERKVISLLKTGASITVISPVLTQKLTSIKDKGSILHICRTYKKGDLTDSFLVIAATDDPSVNTRVAKDSSSPVNVADAPDECTFIVPSVTRRGPLTIAVSTGGASPALASTIRKELEQLYNSEFGKYLSFAGEMRRKAMKAIPDKDERSLFLKGLASEEILQRLRSKGLKAVVNEVSARFEKLIS